MKLHIFNVGHGFCALLRTSDGGVMLFDAGHSDGSFHPSEVLPQHGITMIHRFYLSHFDADHVSDLEALRLSCNINVLHRNRSIPSQIIREQKEDVGGTTAGLDSALQMHNTYIHPAPPEPAFTGVTVDVFCNSYPVFTDMNNLSLVSFVNLGGLVILIPGDLERAGWQELLKNTAFQQALSKVRIFIASHHGRENGYCEEIFTHCSPDVVVISDTDKQYESQEHCYDTHATGMNWGSGKRFVFTTRTDGHITITGNGTGGGEINLSLEIPLL